MKFSSLMVFLPVFIAGCATTMSDDKYSQFADLAAQNQKCFEDGKMNADVYSRAGVAIRSALNTYSFDEGRLSHEYSRRYSNFTANDRSCRQANANAYSVIQQAQEYGQAKTELQNSIRDFGQIHKPVYCSTIGSMTMCN